MQQVPALIFIQGQAGEAGLNAPLAVAEESVGGRLHVAAEPHARPRHALVEQGVAEPDARGEILIQLDRFGVARPLHEGHAAAGAVHIAFQAQRVLDVPDADRSDHGDVLRAHPHFINPGRVELIVLQCRNESVLAVFPESAFEIGTDAAEEDAVLQVADPARGDAGSPGAFIGALCCKQCGGLVPPDVVPLRPETDVQGEVLVGRFDPGEQAILEAGLRAQVAADHVALLGGLLLLLLFLLLLLGLQVAEPLIDHGLDGLLVRRLRRRIAGLSRGELGPAQFLVLLFQTPHAGPQIVEIGLLGTCDARCARQHCRKAQGRAGKQTPRWSVLVIHRSRPCFHIPGLGWSFPVEGRFCGTGGFCGLEDLCLPEP